MLTDALLSRIDHAPRIQILTILLDGGDPYGDFHPALQPHVLRCATQTASVTSRETGESYPFWPSLAQWTPVAEEWAPHERRAPIAQATAKLLPSAGFPSDATISAVAPYITFRLDLWTPGIDLEDAYPLMAGSIVDGVPDRETGGVELTLEDGDTRRQVPFPPGQQTITLDDFPDAPDLVVGQARRQTLFGPFPYPIPAIQIDREGKRWYLCEPAVVAAPLHFQVGGIEVRGADRPVVTTATLGSDPNRTYTQLVFRQPVRQAGLIGAVTASGGVGFATSTPLRTLLVDIGGYPLSRRAELEIGRMERRFNFSVFLNNSSNVMDIVQQRLLPQTDCVLTQHLNQVDLLRLLAPSAQRRIGIGTGFWSRVREQQPLTRTEDVYNVIEVKYRRTVLPVTSDILSRNAYVIDANYGGPIGALVAASQKRYGRRLLSLEAADLVESGSGGLPLGVVELAETTAQLTAFPHRRYVYDAIWSSGMSFARNDTALVTDEARGLSDTPMRVVRREIRPTGPRLWLATDDGI